MRKKFKEFFHRAKYSRMKGRRFVRGKPRTKRTVKRGRYARRGAKRVMDSSNDIARVVATHDLDYDSNGVVYKFSEFSLAGWLRAVAVAQNYQYYRIRMIEMKFIPTADTFQAGATAGEIPNLYYVIDKSDACPANSDLTTLQAMGAKPIRFDDKTITVKYKPAVLLDSWDAQSLQAVPRQYRVSPWLTTNDFNTVGAGFNPSSVDHNGLRWVITGDATFTYQCERVVHIKFRKPMWIESPQAEQITVVSVDTLIDAKLKPLPAPEPPVAS